MSHAGCGLKYVCLCQRMPTQSFGDGVLCCCCRPALRNNAASVEGCLGDQASTGPQAGLQQTLLVIAPAFTLKHCHLQGRTTRRRCERGGLPGRPSEHRPSRWATASASGASTGEQPKLMLLEPGSKPGAATGSSDSLQACGVHGQLMRTARAQPPWHMVLLLLCQTSWSARAAAVSWQVSLSKRALALTAPPAMCMLKTQCAGSTLRTARLPLRLATSMTSSSCGTRMPCQHVAMLRSS